MGNSQPSNSFSSARTDENFQEKIVECNYAWTVTNFRNLTFTVGQDLTSERVKTNSNGINDEWEIVLYPVGYSERTADFISVWLRKVSTSERLVQFTCELWSMRQLNDILKGKALVNKTIKDILSLESVLGWSDFCKRSHILAEENGILNGGNLTLYGKLRIFDNKCIPHPASEVEDLYVDTILSELSENFSQLLQCNNSSDVTFEINGELLYAHKAVLRARSPVFRAMFDSKLLKDDRKITIKDINKKTFLATLQFIYSGKHTKMDFDASMELYYAADKYELMSLRRICSDSLSNSLSTENAVEVLALANMHGDIDLQNSTVDYIARNASVIQKRLDWMEVMKSSPDLANTVFQRLSQLYDELY